MNSDDDIAERCAFGYRYLRALPLVRRGLLTSHHPLAAGTGTWSSTRIYARCCARPASRATTGCSSSSASPSRACDTACATTSEPRASLSLAFPSCLAGLPQNPPAPHIRHSPGAWVRATGTIRRRARATDTSETTTCSAGTHAASSEARGCELVQHRPRGAIFEGRPCHHKKRRPTFRVSACGVFRQHVLTSVRKMAEL